MLAPTSDLPDKIRPLSRSLPTKPIAVVHASSAVSPALLPCDRIVRSSTKADVATQAAIVAPRHLP